MKKLALGALFVGLVTACGGGGSGDDVVVVLPDAPPAAAVCNPIAQTGCADTEKCTWIVDQDTPTEVGHIGCTQDGTVAVHGSCTVGPAGPQGFDDCAKGGICVASECKTICDPQMSGAASGCAVVGGVATESCSRYSGLFETGGMITAGACDPACDPLKQNLLTGTGNTVACGATNPAAPNKGCYTFDFKDFSCAPVGTATLAKTDRVDPVRDTVSGNPFVNGCAPGYVPLFFESGTVQESRCSGSCAVAEIDNTCVNNAAGAPVAECHSKANLGDPLALAKLPTQAAPRVGDGVCNAAAKGSASGGAQNCVFLWNIFQEPPDGQYDETLGFCFAFNQFQFDKDGDGMINPDTTIDPKVPDCKTLPPKSGTTTLGFDDASDFGCQNKLHTLFNGKSSATALRNIVRPGFGPGMALQHKFK